MGTVYAYIHSYNIYIRKPFLVRKNDLNYRIIRESDRQKKRRLGGSFGT